VVVARPSLELRTGRRDWDRLYGGPAANVLLSASGSMFSFSYYALQSERVPSLDSSGKSDVFHSSRIFSLGFVLFSLFHLKTCNSRTSIKRGTKRECQVLEPEDLISGVLRVRRPSDLGACIVKRKKYRQV